MATPVLEIFKQPGGELFYWRLCAETGERFAVSPIGFKRKKDATTNAEDAQALMAQAVISVIA